MNKVDIFQNINDFVRCYGTLCWNLSKVIPFKDMPKIYLSHLPQHVALPNFINSHDDLQKTVCFYTSRLYLI